MLTKSWWDRGALLSLVWVMSACVAMDAGPDAGVQVNVGALSFPSVTDARYELTIHNALGDVLMTRVLDSRSYGPGDGALSFIGPCDASEGANDNTATLTLIDIYAGAAVALVPRDSYQNPGPLARDFTCVANEDTELAFNLTVLRQADQGFFDVAVEFEDIFCSAKLDCEDDEGAPLRLLHDADGNRNTTVVMGLACTGGLGSDTHIYRDPITIDCGGQVVVVDPSAGPGNLAEGSGISGATGLLYGASVTRGAESLGYGKIYWNVMLGLVDGASSCRLTSAATATDHELAGYSTPPNTTYPYLSWDVNLTDAGGALVCTQHPLNGEGAAAGVSTQYTPIAAPHTFIYSYLSGPLIPTQGLIVHWAFDETAAGSCASGADACDSTGHANDGSWVGGVTSAAGYLGRAVSLDGSTGYVAELLPGGWAGGDHSLTTMAWFKADAGFAGPTNGRPVVALGTTANRAHFYTRAFSDPSWGAFNACGGGTSYITLGADDGAADMWHCSGVAAQLDRWYHVASTYDAATQTVSLYIDGTLGISQTLSAPLDLGMPLYAGHDEHAGEFFDGLIDDVRVYDSALSAATIAAIVSADQAAAAECTNGVQDGDETAVDCGGRCASYCVRDCLEVLAADPSASDGTYNVDPDGAGGDAAFDVLCDMSDSAGGWTQLNASFLASLSVSDTFEYLYTYSGAPGAWYRSPATTTLWSWSTYVALNGTWNYSDTGGTLGTFACTSAETGGWGVGCSNGGGPQWKIIGAYEKDEALGTSKLCQDQPDVFNVGACAAGGQIWVRKVGP